MAKKKYRPRPEFSDAGYGEDDLQGGSSPMAPSPAPGPGNDFRPPRALAGSDNDSDDRCYSRGGRGEDSGRQGRGSYGGGYQRNDRNGGRGRSGRSSGPYRPNRDSGGDNQNYRSQGGRNYGRSYDNNNSNSNYGNNDYRGGGNYRDNDSDSRGYDNRRDGNNQNRGGGRSRSYGNRGGGSYGNRGGGRNDNRGGDNRGSDNRGGYGGRGSYQSRGGNYNQRGGYGQRQNRYQNDHNHDKDMSSDSYYNADREENAADLHEGRGMLELHPNGYGFLRSPDNNYARVRTDPFVPGTMIERYGLRPGIMITGQVRPGRGQTGPRLKEITDVDGLTPEEYLDVKGFDSLTPINPTEWYNLETGKTPLTNRVIDLLVPMGKGQRALIVAPPKAGKTLMMQNIAQSITRNNPECHLMVLLIDERPEEVTEMQRSVRGEVVASTFDEPPARHVQVAEMVIEKAKRLVEHKQDVVIILDSITRLARAYNTIIPSSGKVLTGGVDAHALERPKRFFGAARNVEEGGSLTIIATALVYTGSKMDEVIFEEFKGTGNMEVHLDRRIAEKRTYPAINIRRSGTRREDLLMSDDELQRVWILRKLLHNMDDDIAATEFLLDKLKDTKTNDEFFLSMKKR